MRNAVELQKKKELVYLSLWISGVAIGSFILSVYYLDQIIFNAFKQPDNQIIRYYSREVTNVGLSGHYFLLAIAGMILSRFVFPKINYFNRKKELLIKLFAWSYFLFWNLFFIGIGLNVLKIIFGRQRPHVSAEFNNLNFRPFSFEEHYYSLPSGHTQVLFSLAAILSLILPKKVWLFVLIAFIFSFTRASIEQHWLSDVIAGAWLGYLSVLWFYFYFPPNLKQ